MEEGYRPQVGAAETLLSFTAEAAPPANVELQQPCESKIIQEIDDSQLVGVPVHVAVDSVVSAVEPSAAFVEVKPILKMGEMVVVEKRKRGRPPRAQGKPPPLKRKKEEEDEEDVCFICFDGGSLVLCDRRGCPKAYHPACIKRDEAFFRSKAKWNCGWHICSVCQRASHYVCYTCTYSLCKGCTRDADYLCVRGNKGFCMTCMRTIMLIENNGRENKDMVQVDFDDKNSWEYLFKVYWIYLKEKLSLTSEELVQAKNPWKGAGIVAGYTKSSDACFGDIDVKGSVPVGRRVQPSDLNYCRSDGKVSISNISRHEEVNISSKINPNEQLGLLNGNPLIQEIPASSSDSTLVGCPDWASRELLEFVAHMRNGDKSVLSQFDVQALLLDYIKRNNLRDPRRKSEIVCDLRLNNLFGKPRVGHIEMLKLLEFHFLMKEDSQKDIFARTGFMNAIASHVEGEGFSDNITMMGKDKKRKTRKKGEERLPLVNLDEYAAIDAHNINLIYLRRELMETLIEDDEKFYDKVVGSIVRIRVSGSDQKQDIYRLVQVVGTNKVAVPYKVGDKTADMMLEVLNLDKKETVSIDAISNQEFSEDECRRLRQSIKCGLVKRLTVGEIQEKAMALQGLRLNDLLEAEILRLNHLRDRASEKGHKKELRKCVEKLELLKTPEERQRRLCEVPEVHADPRMGPNYESEDDAQEFNTKKRDEYAKPRFSGFPLSGSKQISPQKVSNIFSDTDCKAYKNAPSYEGSRSLSTAFNSSKDQILSGTPGRVKEGRNLRKLNSLGKLGDRVNSVSPAVGILHGQTVVRSASFLGVASETSRVPFSERIMSATNNDNEKVKLWHYRDPSGKIQGPFCMLQLRKWSTTGLFPSDMRIWVSDEQEGSILLTDALNGRLCKVPLSPWNISLQSQEAEGASDCRSYTCDGGGSRHVNATGREDKGGEGIVHGSNVHSDSNNEFVRGHSSDSNTPAVTFKDIQVVSCSPDLSKVNSSDQLQVRSPHPSSTLSGQVDVSLPHQGGSEHGSWSDLNHANWSPQKTLLSQVNGVHSHDNLSNSGQSSDQNRRSSAMPSNSMDIDSNFAPMTALSSDKIGDLDTSDLPSPTPKASNMDWEGEATKNKESLSANVPVSGLENLEGHGAENNQSIRSDLPVQDADGWDLPGTIPDPKNDDKKGENDESKQFVPLNFPVQDSGRSWSSASSLVVGGTQVPELADEGGGCSPSLPSLAKSSVEEWESSHVCVSSLKLHEAGSDHVNTPTSNNDHVNHTSPSDPASNVSNWQTVLTETIEFSTLAEESVSDLLAQVDAMESQSGLASPTSAMNRGEELLQDSIEDLCPTPDPGKSDALSSTGDVQLPCQSAETVETFRASHADLFESLKRTGGQSSASPEAVGETKSANSLLDHGKAGSDIQPPVQSTVHQLVHTEIIRSAGLGSMDSGYGGTQSSQGTQNMGLEIGPGMSRGSVNMIRGTTGGGLVGDSQRKYGVERFTGPRDWASQGDSGYNRGRLSWSRQSFAGGGGGYSRPLPKGQRVCKFYESGYCKKGALCNYLHP